MGVNVQSGTTSVTGTVTANLASGGMPGPSAVQTLVHGTVSLGSTGATLYTVSAGKTFYCLGFQLGVESVAGTVNLVVDGTTYASASMNALGNTVFSGSVLFSLAATKAITITHNAGANKGNAFIWGYEV